MAALLAVCLIVSKFSIRIDSLTLSAVLTGPLLAIAGLGLVSSRRIWGWRIGFVMLAIAQFGFLGTFAGPLSYIAAAAGFPLQDTNFARLDGLLGLDWLAYYRFVMAWPVLLPYAYLSYAAIIVPCLGVPLALGLMGHFVRLQQFVIATILMTAVDVAVSSALPAIGTYSEFELSPQLGDFKANGYLVQLEILPVLRAGGLRVLDLADLGGIITFPSLHAAASILAIWGFWSVWWLRPPAQIVYIAMLFATPLIGGHYFVDVIAGIGVAVFSIAAAKRLSPSIPEAARIAAKNSGPSALPA
jgi:hypothetical protein